MKYIFCGNMFSDLEKDIKKMKVPPTVSGHKYQENLISGILGNGQDVTVVNIPRIRFFPHYPRVFFFRKTFLWGNVNMGEEIGFINLPILNYITQKIFLTRALKKHIRRFGKEPCVLLCFNTYLPMNQAMLKIRKEFKNVVLCDVIGDLHGNYGVRIAGRYDGIKGKIVRLIENKQDSLSCRYDTFGFLTASMAQAMRVEHKPHVIIEGMYAGKRKNKQTADDGPLKIIFYAGAVEEEYGIIHLLDAFSLIRDSHYRLKIAGSGGAVNKVLKRAETDDRICYLGYIIPQEVEKYQQAATVLVNPRKSDHEYVKYSFPSKNMECLASGKPYIAHKLPCNLPEYDAFIQYPMDETDAALAEKIVEICEWPKERRQALGMAAETFILNEKNPKMQCKKIVDMLQTYRFRHR